MDTDYSRLYYFAEDFDLSGRVFRVNPEIQLKVDEVEAYARGQIRPTVPISFVQQSGKLICDVIWTGFPPLVLVSRTFLDVATRNGLGGWSSYPVQIYDANRKELRGYAGLSFLGRAGAVDFSRSKKVWRGPMYEGGPKWQNHLGLFFNHDYWDGSDFFMADGQSGTYVTERVRQALKVLKIQNVEFERLSEYEQRVRTPRSNSQ